MTLENDEGLVTNLNDFEKLTVKTISPQLEDYLKTISKTGDTCHNWNIVKPLLVYKLERVLDDFMETVTENGEEGAPTPAEFQSTKERLSCLLNGFYRAPFTVQRLLELLLEPNKHYKKFEKYARGLEKVLSVVTTVDPFPKKAPSSLLPNTVLNGNGLMRAVNDVAKKLAKGLVNGEVDPKSDECKKRSNVAEERSPKRQRVEEIEDKENGDHETPEFETSPDPEIETKLEAAEEPSIVMGTPDSSIDEPSETKCEPSENAAPSDHDQSSTEESNTEVCTTTCPQVETDNIPEKVSEIQEEKSLSAILLDHPSDREG